MNRNLFILAFFPFLLPYGNYYGYHSSTAAQGYLNGMASLYQGQGQYLMSLGVYENYHQDAYRKHLENSSYRIQERWMIKDMYRERHRNGSYLEYQARKQDIAMKQAAQPHEQGYITVNGKRYRNTQEWLASAEYAEFKKHKKPYEPPQPSPEYEQRLQTFRWLYTLPLGERMRFIEQMDRERRISEREREQNAPLQSVPAPAPNY